MRPDVRESGDAYRIRRLMGQDAAAFSGFEQRMSAGGGHKNLDDPEQLLALNESGALISAVAVDGAHRIVGYSALTRPGLERIAESGESMVLPELNGLDLVERMGGLLEREALSAGLLGLSYHAAVDDEVRQKLYERSGCQATGIMFEGLLAPAKEGCAPWLLYFKYLVPPPRALVSIQGRHQPMIERIYQGLGREIEWAENYSPLRPGQLDATYLPDLRQGLIQIREAGYRTADAAAQSCTSLCDLSDAAVVSLELPVGQPQAAQVCGELEQRGFAFAAIKPGDGGDFLVMQFLAAPPAAPTSKIQNEFARELVAYVAGEIRRVHPGAGGS